MSTPCTQEDTIKDIHKSINILTNNMEMMNKYYADMVETTKKNNDDISRLINNINDHMIKSAELTATVRQNTEDINNIASLMRETRHEINDVKFNVGKNHISDLSEKLAVHEDFLKGVKYVGGGVILSIAGLIVTAIATAIKGS